ncbi:hypothetical protein [Virgibacillus sp. CBA3643]|uniref:hypothetical protein n=1 Tax=Virgibacillus sp. CBA3643 TaxID=2942278 RepID=UPI0035A3C520
MKKMTLIDLNLKNFKGIKDYSLKADSNDLNVLGTNATGKTTLFDGFIWLLFGKDSQNRTDFEIKELDEKGNVKQHGLDHEVEGVFEIDNERISLKRVYAENWTKKQGSAHKKFSGHSTTYFIDGVSKKKKEFTDKVNEIISEDVFKLLTNPLYFNQKLGWKERRDILLNISGDITQEEIASGNSDLEKFIKDLNGRDIEDHKKVIQQQQKEINKELDRIPVRIDELQLNQDDTKGLDKEKLDADVVAIDKDIQSHQEAINDIRSGVEVNNKRKDLSDIELQILNIKNEHGNDERQEMASIQTSIQEKGSNVSILNSDIETKKEQLKSNQEMMAQFNDEVDELRKEWATENKKEFQHNDECECPTCGQELPKDQVEATKEKALTNFNKEKSEKLESIMSKAKKKKETVNDMEKKNEKLEQKIDGLIKEVQGIEKKKESLQQKHDDLKEKITDVTQNTEYKAKLEEKETIEKEIKEMQESVQESISVKEKEIRSLEENKKEVQSDLSKLEAKQKSDARIVELEDQESKLTQEYEGLEYEIHLTDEYTRKRVNLLEEKINKKFKYARFKLFEEQLNGGLKETCETLYDGVPYNSGLNNAGKINIGLDIINTLNEHYNVNVPIFIDNAEAVINLIDTESQVIGLTVKDVEDMETKSINKENKSA